MKKVCLLLCSIFLLTGCSAEYNLIYEENILTESLNVISSNDTYIDGQTVTSLVDNYYKKVDLMVDYTIDPGEMSVEEKKEKYDFYNKKLINANGLYGINLNFDYKDKSKLSKSVIAITGFEDIEVSDNSIIAKTPSYIFDNYPYLEEIVVTFKTDKKVLETNCDEKKEGVYYWYINKSNYDYKSIKINIDNSINQIEQKKTIDIITKYGLIGLITVIFVSIIFVSIKISISNKK